MSAVRRCAAFATVIVVECLAAHAAIAAVADRSASTASESATVTVRAQSVGEQFQAYGQVQPIAVLPVRAVEAGVVAALRVFPGSRVKAGETLATLTGPEIQSLLVSREGAVRSTRIQLAAERQRLTAQLSTEQAVAAATAALNTARAQLEVAQAMSTLRVPSAGTVLAVSVAEGERVAAGQTLMTLQTTNGLWLTARYYGRDAQSIRVGMTGRFEPAAGGPPVPVKVVAVSAVLAPDGGESVGLLATDLSVDGRGKSAAPWFNGEKGAVILEGPTHALIVVPTRALILDRAHWWVLVRTPKGDRPQEVVPGPSRGWQTYIERGLTPAERVVVQNAYLEFHRGISQHYTPPD
ncbi:MAG: efflux RND transporter periplasmic adaptor subunit [Steroidobacteraceae bacterium]